MSKVFMWVGGGFLAIGLLFIAVAGGMHWHGRGLAQSGDRAQGTVIDLVRGPSGENGPTYRPVVEFRDANGVRHEITSKVGSRPPSFSRGEQVEVIYDPQRPERAMIDSFSTRHVLPLFFAGMGALFTIFGGTFTFLYLRRQKTVRRLKQTGRTIEAEFIDSYLDTSTTMNGRNPFRITCQAVNPATGKLQSFKSDPIWVDLGSVLKGKKIPVLIDPQNTRKYWVDLSNYVSEDQRA